MYHPLVIQYSSWNKAVATTTLCIIVTGPVNTEHVGTEHTLSLNRSFLITIYTIQVAH